MTQTQTKKYLDNKFKALQFEEKEHLYAVNKKSMTSTSNKIKDFYKEFPLMEASKNYAKKRNLKQKDVLNLWKKKSEDACKLGTDVHNFAERFILSQGKHKVKKGDSNKKKKRQIIRFWKELPKYYSCISVEHKMYSPIYNFAGTTDFLLYDKRDNSVVIGDYKTNKDIHKNYNNRMKKPFGHLIDSPYNHYQLQLSFYQILLEDVGIHISNRVIVWIKDDDYILYFLNDYTKQLRKTLKDVS